jgi:hypothetical protein
MWRCIVKFIYFEIVFWWFLGKFRTMWLKYKRENIQWKFSTCPASLDISARLRLLYENVPGLLCQYQ